MKKLFLVLLLMAAAKSILADDLTATVTNATDSLNNGAIDLILNGGVAPYTFQWTGPNGYSSSDEDITNLEPGAYCVTVSDLYCGAAVLCVLVEEDLASGMLPANASSLNVFPNPFSKEFTIVFELSASGAYFFELYDLSGKSVWTEMRLLASGANTSHFVLEDPIASGRYEVIIRNERGSLLSRSVVNIR